MFYFPPNASRCQGLGVVQILLFVRMEWHLRRIRKKTISAPSNFVHFFPAWKLGYFLIIDCGWVCCKLKPVL